MQGNPAPSLVTALSCGCRPQSFRGSKPVEKYL